MVNMLSLIKSKRSRLFDSLTYLNYLYSLLESGRLTQQIYGNIYHHLSLFKKSRVKTFENSLKIQQNNL